MTKQELIFIYTADRFLEYYQQKYQQKSIDKMLINEVRKIRELEEMKMTRARDELSEYNLQRGNLFVHGRFEEDKHLYMEIEMLLNELMHLEMRNKYFDELQFLSLQYSRQIKILHKIFDEEINHLLKRIMRLLKMMRMEQSDEYFSFLSRKTIEMIRNILR